MAELSEAESVRRLIDRLGFGAGGEELALLRWTGYAAVVDTLARAERTGRRRVLALVGVAP